MSLSGRTGIFYGWILAAVVFLANFMSVGTGLYAMNAFMQPLCQLRGWTRTDLNLALVAGTIAAIGGQFIYGALVRRLPIRRIMVAGMLCAGTAFVLMTRVNCLWQFYLVYMMLFLGNGAYGGIVANTVINNWFIQKRGKAMGVATSGVSLAGAAIPLAAMHLIVTQGIHMAANLIGAAIMVLAPLAWWTIRDWPEDHGLHPDGSFPSDADRANQTSEECDRSTAHCVHFTHTAVFWKLGLSFGLLMSGAVGVLSQLKPRLVDIGFTDLQAMLLLSLTALWAAAGKYVWGRLSDRFRPCRVAGVLAMANALGLAIALFGSHRPLVVIFSMVFGFAVGGITPLFPILTAGLFGRQRFSHVHRVVSLFLILQIGGYVIAGQSYDRSGSYDLAYITFALFDIIAAVLLWSIPADRHSGLDRIGRGCE
jgi:sugar phosphate permease